MQVVELHEDLVVAEVDGVRREASLLMLADPVKLGDYVIVHAGFAISRLDAAEAEETLQLMREILDSEESQ